MSRLRNMHQAPDARARACAAVALSCHLRTLTQFPGVNPVTESCAFDQKSPHVTDVGSASSLTCMKRRNIEGEIEGGRVSGVALLAPFGICLQTSGAYLPLEKCSHTGREFAIRLFNF